VAAVGYPNWNIRILEEGYRVPLYIRDDEVAALARDLQRASGARSVTEAVRTALERDLARLRDSVPPSARLDKALAIADRIGGTGAARPC